MILEADILNASILVVDDQAVNVKLLTRLLGDAGYTRVQSTQDPTVVCALHRRQAFDLILLDLQMPGMDGFAVMEGLKTNAEEAFLPVIVLTAQPGHKLRALGAGARDFISKPFDLLEVKTRIHNMLEVRLLYRQLAAHAQTLERAVQERTAELRESEARYRSLTELAADWYWEQDEQGHFTKLSGPVLEMLGLHAGPLADMPETAAYAALDDGWDVAERQSLLACIAARRPFLDFALHRSLAGGKRQQFRVSGQPMFNQSARFLGYRGVGVETTPQG